MILIENALQVRGVLLAQAAAIWAAGQAVDLVVSTLPPDSAAEWRGPAAQAEAQRVREVRDRVHVARARLSAAADLVSRNLMVVDLHVG